MIDLVEFGDCREIMSHWAFEGVQVQTCVTSPPYFGLRDYKAEGQLGLEEKPDEYVANLVSVFRTVREILADDGTVWLNLGDSYCSNGKGKRDAEVRSRGKNIPRGSSRWGGGNNEVEGLKCKDLIGIPWRVAFALQADGWYLRQDIIWAKPNAMPESVRDRCTRSHEYIFLLAKNAKYYFDSDAIKTPCKDDDTTTRKKKARFGGADKHEQFGTRIHSGREYFGTADGMANKRSVWSVTTKPYRGAHVATFPPDLIEPCVLAGSRAGDIVLDPFMGSGTTAQVALQHGRHYLGCELNREYEALQLERIGKVVEMAPSSLVEE